MAKSLTDAQRLTKFETLANVRAAKALRGIQGLEKLANKNKYPYTAAHIAKLRKAFQTALSKCFDAFEKGDTQDTAEVKIL